MEGGEQASSGSGVWVGKPGGEESPDFGEDRFRFCHASGAGGAAGEFPFFRIEQVHTACAEALQVGYGGGVRKHPVIHRGGGEDGSGCGEEKACQEVVGDAVGVFGEGVGGGGGEEEEIGALGECDVSGGGGEGLPHAGMDGAVGEGFEGQGGDESLGGIGHDHIHIGTFPEEEAAEVGGLVGGDASGDTEEEGFPGEAHDPPLFFPVVEEDSDVAAVVEAEADGVVADVEADGVVSGLAAEPSFAGSFLPSLPVPARL